MQGSFRSKVINCQRNVEVNEHLLVGKAHLGTTFSTHLGAQGKARPDRWDSMGRWFFSGSSGFCCDLTWMSCLEQGRNSWERHGAKSIFTL